MSNASSGGNRQRGEYGCSMIIGVTNYWGHYTQNYQMRLLYFGEKQDLHFFLVELKGSTGIT